jgi:hypothetical protein
MRNPGLCFRGLLLPCAVALVCAPALAQFDTGSFVGTVHDSTGALVAGATVTVTNTETSISVTRVSGADGSWEVPSLHTGTYTVTISRPGFAQASAQNLTLSVGARQRVDLSLQAGGTTETVEVTGVTLQLETEDSQRDQTITGYESAAFPLVTRNYSDLLGLVTGSRQAPTAATTSSISSLVRAGSYNINGERSMFNNFLLDGLDNNAYGESNQGFDNQIIAIPPDSVAQFQVVTNNESAEYGRSSGATINVASNSGTNRFHALAYEFIRNTDLNAEGFFKPTQVGSSGITVPFKKPTFNRNQYGVNFGGPIQKDRLFFFVDYEGFRQVLKPLSVLTLPTQNELNGILAVPVRNPRTGQTYAAGTAIPTSAIDSVSASIITAFRAVPGISAAPGLSTTGLAQDNYAVQVPFTDNSDKGDLRLDFQQSPSTSWFARVSDRKEDALNAPALGLPLDGQTNGRIRVLDQQAVLGFTKLFGADKVLDARMGISRTKAGKFSTSIGSTPFNIPGLPTNPSVAGGLPSISITNFSVFGRQSTNPQFQNPALLDPKVNFTLVKGKHSLKFGYEYEHVWMAVSDNNPLYGSFTYGGGYSLCPAGTTVAGPGGVPTVCPANLPGAPSTSAVADNYWADFLFGATSVYSAANVFTAHLRQTTDNVYAQDDWKVLPQLTLNLGLRWEYSSPYSEQNDFISNFDPTTQTILTINKQAVTRPGAVTVIPNAEGIYGKTLINPDYKDFAPRVGFAYAADAKTAVRGGFGISYAHYTRAGSGDILAINAPQALFVAVNQNNLKPTPTNQCAGTPSVASIGTCYVGEEQGFPTGLTTTFNPLTDNTTYVPRNTRDSYVESYFLSVQRELAKNVRMDVAYVGNHGLKLQGFVNANQLNPSVGFAQANRPFPNFSDITEALNEFSSNYNSLQVRYEQRFVGGLTLLNSFTWSHSLDMASASLEGNTPAPQDGNNIRGDYGQSDYNVPLDNVTSIIDELPFGRGRRFLSSANGFVDAVLGGWQVSIINTMQSGTPFDVAYSPSSTNSVSPTIAATYRGANIYRPNVVPGVNKILNTQIASTGYIQYVNPAAFTLPATTVGGVTQSPFGNASRNLLRNTPFYETDMTLNKRFSTPIESLKVEFRSEFYNLLNHTNLYIPSDPSAVTGTLGGPATGGGQITSTFQPRVLQFALKLIY